MELFDINAPEEIDSLQQKLTVSYPLLDPMLPDEGKFMARWKLRLNVTPDEIKAILEMCQMIAQRNISLLSSRLAEIDASSGQSSAI
ncbi:hypothetical protein [Desulfosarcina ovata]|uniref:Uncharacterized protein n=1 Tax=Desulfosarcina ovata subsp. ovata TaxID=2752305 RepID=A0A5K8A7C0_9BACT|nr:hypothetical protein [Desulfosarcina ovata]BBO88040.1 hypothetical protein DSCOOX_12200 [Desulfosarcina ovata subsp. ovata]